MESTHTLLSGKAVVVAALLLAIGFTASAGIKAYSDLKNTELQRSLSVTGHASRSITSDHMKWSLTVSKDATSHNPSGNPRLEASIGNEIDKVAALLRDGGIADLTVSKHPVQQSSYDYPTYPAPLPMDSGKGGSSPVTIQEIPPTTNNHTEQVVVFETSDVKKMNDLTGAITNTILQDGFTIINNQTEFTYTKRDELRRELVVEASKDAQKIANDIGLAHVGDLIRIDSGAYLTMVPQGSSASQNYYSGSDDVSSIEKRADIDLNVTYLIK